MNKFNVGDVVMLNSGGPKMTISSIESDRVWCIWFITSNVVYGIERSENIYNGPFIYEFTSGSLTLVS